MGYHNLLCAHIVQGAGGFLPVGQSRHNLGFGGVGFQIADVGEHIAFVAPVLEVHFRARASAVTEETLHIDRDIAALFEQGNEGGVEVAVDKSAEVIYFGVEIGYVAYGERVALRAAHATAFLLVLGEIFVFYGSGSRRGQTIDVVAGQGENAQPVAVGFGEFRDCGDLSSESVRRRGRVDHRAAYLHGEIVVTVYVVVERHMPDDDAIVTFHCRFAPIKCLFPSPLCRDRTGKRRRRRAGQPSACGVCRPGFRSVGLNYNKICLIAQG